MTCSFDKFHHSSLWNINNNHILRLAGKYLNNILTLKSFFHGLCHQNDFRLSSNCGFEVDINLWLSDLNSFLFEDFKSQNFEFRVSVPSLLAVTRLWALICCCFCAKQANFDDHSVSSKKDYNFNYGHEKERPQTLKVHKSLSSLH